MAQSRPAQIPLRPRARSGSPISRPTTPLRASSRSSFRASTTTGHYHQGGGFPDGGNPLDTLEPQFAELADSMADLETNLMHLQLMHESLSRFGESFAGFLYGLNMNAFVVDFPEAPITESIKRWKKRQQRAGAGGLGDESTILASGGSVAGHAQSEGNAGDATFMTSVDNSFASLRATPRRKSLAPPVTPGTSSTVTAQQSRLPGVAGRGGGLARRGSKGGGVAGRGARGSGLPRGRGRGVR